MKKFAFISALILALFCLSFACAEEYTSGDFEYILLEDGTAEITGYRGEAAGLEIPAELDGHVVTGIGDEAFADCSFLTEIIIPDGVVAVGINPFKSCKGLNKIVVSPDNAELATIDGVLFVKSEKKLICYPCAFTDGSYAIPQGILVVGDAAFYGCGYLEKLTVPDSVTTIGASAFSDCASLGKIDLPDSVNSIGDSAFASCYSLERISIPEGVTSIGANVFSSCASLEEIELPESVTTIRNSAFSGCMALTEIDLPAAVTSIGNYAFSNCYALSEIEIPEAASIIGHYAFSGCSSLAKAVIPANVFSIGDSAFSGCPDTLTLTVERDSYAAEYAEANRISYTYPDANDWLNS